MDNVKARKIRIDIRQEILGKDLELYKEKAVQLGATDAKIISASEVRVDPRVRLKCLVPRCHLYGETPNCPPYTPEPHQMTKIIKRYDHAVLIKNDVLPVEDFVDNEKWHKAHMAHQRKTHDIVSGVEALAFKDGYYFAAGFAAGGCKTTLCGGRICQFLDSGRCRFPLKARPSMEAVGIDVYRLVSEVGWKIYPVPHKGVDAESIPCAISVGIVFVI